MSDGVGRPRIVEVIGVDGVRGGWVAAVVAAAEATPTTRVGTVTWRVGARLSEVVDTGVAGTGAVAVDIPIGLSAGPPRACDAVARRRLPGRASCVFPAPVQQVLTDWRLGVEYAEVVRRCRANAVPAPSRQTWAITDKVADAADLVAGRAPEAAAVVETHPEVSFAAMAGEVLPPKTGAQGVGQRMRALNPWVDAAQALSTVPAGVPVADALDALACAWTAARVHAGTAERLGEAPLLIWV